MKKVLFGWLVGCALIVPVALLPSLAFADPTSGIETTENTDGTVSYKFGDDLLDGKGLDIGSALIKVRPRAQRSGLIRPRVSFVPELYKTVENL